MTTHAAMTNGPGAGPAPLLLDVEGISISFGGLKAVSSFSLKLPKGRLAGLIGPNGAGKTTVFNLLTGVYKSDTGTIRLGDLTLTGLKPYQRAKAGLARTFQNIRLFPDLSVLDNVRIASHLRAGETMAGAILRSRYHVGEERAMTALSMELLEIFDLAHRRDEQARNLSYGDQRRLEIARALATSPKVLLLDEPAAGMNPQEKRELRDLIRSIRERFGLTILLIEHDMEAVFALADRISVLVYGRVIASGKPDEIRNNAEVKKAYLGDGKKAGEHG